ncbi:MAG: M56 family metallopeptidase, partial [Methanomicrobia archaeon]|nr:M56 family metallopeptidase [Methanomicrobia archaeon]
MNSLFLIVYCTSLTVIIFLINELLITIFDPCIQTRNRIHKLTLISFFSVFAIVPFKIIQGLIIQGSRIVKGDSLIILANKIDYITEYTNFAYLIALLVSVIFFSFLFIIFFDKNMMYRLYHLYPSEDKKIEKKLQKISVQMNIRPPKLYFTRDSLEVFVFGLKPKLALGEEFIKKCTEKELEIVLKHELWHIKNKDLWVKMMSISLRILFFYNPVIFLLIRKIEKESEYMADISSVKTKEEKKAYIKLMLKLSSLNSFKISMNTRTTNAFPIGYPEILVKLDRRFSTKRVENLFKIRKNKRFLPIVSLFCTVLLMIAGISLGSFLAQEGKLNENYSEEYSYRYLDIDTNYYSTYTETMEEQEYIFIHRNNFKINKENIKERMERLGHKKDNYELLILTKGKVFPKEIQEYLKGLEQEPLDTNSTPDT